MTKRKQPQKRKVQRSRLVTAPRRYINTAVIVGGAIGFVIQSAFNMDNEGAFILTGVCCFAAVAVVNFSWLYHVRRKEGRRND